MLWHAELLAEFLLVAVICWRHPKLPWWEALIGVDFIANMFQLATYRGGYIGHSRQIWLCGVVLAAPLLFMALAEQGRAVHRAVLYFWLTAQLTCVTLQTQRDLLIPANDWLLGLDTLCFAAWAVAVAFRL